MSLDGTPDHWQSMAIFCITTGFFLPEKSMFCSKINSFSLCSYSSEHHGYILSSEQGKLHPQHSATAKEGGSSSRSCMLGTKRASTRAHRRQCYNSILSSCSQRNGSYAFQWWILPLSCQTAWKQLSLHQYFSGYCLWSKQGILEEVLELTGLWHLHWQTPCPSFFRLVYIHSLGIPYIKCNMVNRPEVTHRRTVEKISCRYETQPLSIWF